MKILDGAFGTLTGEYGLSEDVYVLDGKEARGCVDVLCLTRPDVVADIHRRYAEAGADIITTNSLSANAVSLAEYGLERRAYDIARRAAEIAKTAGKQVAGSMGPTDLMLSRNTCEKPRLLEAYRTQAQGLIDGGADLLLVETVTDVLNARVALSAIRSISAAIPIMVAATLDPSGRLLSGQSVEEFCEVVADAHPMSIGLNCGYGPVHLLPYARRLRAVAPCAVSVHPNAGMPGHYASPHEFAADMAPYVSERLVDIAGGCCGTTPAHIAALKASISDY